MKNSRKPDKELMNEMYIKFDQFEVPEFAVKLHGYDREEVDKYLNALVDAYNQMYEEYKDMEAELGYYRENKEAIAEVLIETKINAKVTATHSVSEEPTYYSDDINQLLEEIIAESEG